MPLDQDTIIDKNDIFLGADAPDSNTKMVRSEYLLGNLGVNNVRPLIPCPT